MAAYPQDYATACFLCFAVLSAVFGATYALVMLGVRERPLCERTELPFTSSLMRLLANDKYRVYLIMRIPMTVLGLLPAQLFLYYLQVRRRRRLWCTACLVLRGLELARIAPPDGRSDGPSDVPGLPRTSCEQQERSIARWTDGWDGQWTGVSLSRVDSHSRPRCPLLDLEMD